MTETPPQHDRGVMTDHAGARYSRPVMNGLQHSGAFVVQFRAGTDFETGRVEGRVEHVATGRTARFASADELLTLVARMLKDLEFTPRSEEPPALQHPEPR